MLILEQVTTSDAASRAMYEVDDISCSHGKTTILKGVGNGSFGVKTNK